MTHDLFLRAHTTYPRKTPRQRPPSGPKWPDLALVFDCETRIDTAQQLTLGVYRLCRLRGEVYETEAEGLFYGDDLNADERAVLEQYVGSPDHHPFVTVQTFPPKLRLPLYARSAFVEQVFWKAIQRGALVVGFNLKFDLSRLAVRWRPASDGGFSLIFSLRRSRKTGQIEPNPERPRIRITAKDSHAAFITLLKPQRPEEWPHRGRFLDCHTLASALYHESFSLDDLCKELHLPGKVAYEPTGRVTPEEIDYCRGDVRATTDVLNSLKREFDRHPIEVPPDRAYSPASIAKAYLDVMGILPPLQKFKVPEKMLGIAMQSYYGGRAECRTRHVEVPVVHTDFTANYPMCAVLLGNWGVVTAERLTFDEATDDVRALLQRVTLDDVFDPACWKRLSFFALVQPDDDILPVRTVYNGVTQNIGVNYARSDYPVWFAGPDLVASVLLARKVPRVLKAIRMVPHGKQRGLRPTTLRGMVAIDPRTQDFCQHAVEQRQRYKTSNETLAAFLKDTANSGAYGLFVELSPERRSKPVTVHVFSGEHAFEVHASKVVEQPGRWYFPPLAALITAAGRLLLATLERCVADAGGTYLFCDTDSLCIVAAEHATTLVCDGRPLQVISRQTVEQIVRRFVSLNPYKELAGTSILKIEKVNADSAGRARRLLGFAVSAKRYVLYEREGVALTIVDATGHGLGYLCPPVSKRKRGDPDWTVDAWAWIVRQRLSLPAQPPPWLDLPAMMRIAISTPTVLARLQHVAGPFSFFLCPLIDNAGYPSGIDRNAFVVVIPFTKDRAAWLDAEATNVCDGTRYRLAFEQNAAHDRVIPQTLGSILRQYPCHLESKSLAPDGSPCLSETRGVLQRAAVTVGRLRFVGKETDRHWDQGDDLSLLQFTVREYAETTTSVAADVALKARTIAFGMRPLIRKTGLSQHTLEKILRGEPVRSRTLKRVIDALG